MLTYIARGIVPIGAVIGVILLATLLPFLPGPFDSLAEPLSALARLFGLASLVLVPIGGLWVASMFGNWLAGRQYGIAITALVVSSILWILLSVAAWALAGFVLSFCCIAVGLWAFARLLPAVKFLKGTPRPMRPAAFYLLIVPVAVVLIQMATVAPAIEFSRNRGIENAAALIADIEQYRIVNGRYPSSLLSVQEDYKPGVIGIKGYHYEPHKDAYNLIFEQPALSFGTREFVVYNPHDEQVMTSHKLDRVQLTPQELALDQTRGHNAVHAARQPHWKYFWFD